MATRYDPYHDASYERAPLQQHTEFQQGSSSAYQQNYPPDPPFNPDQLSPNMQGMQPYATSDISGPHHRLRSRQEDEESIVDEYEIVTRLNNKRIGALREADNAEFGWFYFKVCLVAGVGFFTDAYDIFAITPVATMLGYVYGHELSDNIGVCLSGSSNLLPSLGGASELGLKIATPLGTFIGQLLFGWLGDVFGRKRMYGLELTLIIIATLAQALAGNASAVGIITGLIIWRLILGVGVGGDYPLSAIITSEFAPVHIRGRLMTAVFANQGLGQLCAGIVTIISVSAFSGSFNSFEDSKIATDRIWRLIIGIGIIPGAIALCFRLTIPETPRATMDIQRNVDQAVKDIDNFLWTGKYVNDPDAKIEHVAAPQRARRDFLRHFGKMENWTLLVATSYSWFANDVAFYGLTLNFPLVLQQVKSFGLQCITTPNDAYDNLHRIAVGNLILTVAGLLPGYIGAFFLIDVIGRRALQTAGFLLAFVFLAVMGFTSLKQGAISGEAFFALACLTNLCMNLGPNTTSFIIPGELFPTRYRSTAHGISAASGKLGAIIVQLFLFAETKNNSDGTIPTGDGLDIQKPVSALLIFCAFFMLSGIISTWMVPETMGKTLEELSNEDQEGFITGPAIPLEHGRPVKRQ